MLGQAMGRLIDTYHPAIRVVVCQQSRTHSSAAKGIEYQRARLFLQRVLENLKRRKGVLWARFTPGMRSMMSDHREKIRVGVLLIREDPVRRVFFTGCLRGHSHLAIIPRGTKTK